MWTHVSKNVSFFQIFISNFFILLFRFRLERLQRLAEKVHREIKRIDTRLEDLESKIKEEARRLERLHPLDAKHNVDLLEQELHIIEESIQSLFSDVESLRDGRYPQASDLHKRYWNV